MNAPQSIELDAYVQAAERYRPALIRTLFIAESPPAYSSESKKSYFYFEDNPGGDVLFATVMEAIFSARYRKNPTVKRDLLLRFQTEGYWLMDAVEEPINRVAGNVNPVDARRKAITNAMPSLLARLRQLGVREARAEGVGIILIKKLVFDLLATPLREHGFLVLNDGKIDFPKYHYDRDTIAGIRKALAAGKRDV